eukprot:12980972-Alexandrium_andersonii.AAC.1
MCLRRVAEAAVASVVGPLLEPTFSERHAARHGGTCRRNVRLALAHLEGTPRATAVARDRAAPSAT